MFVCAGCGQHGRDEQLQYTIIDSSRARHPSAQMFVLRFHNLACLDQFLRRVSGLGQLYILTDYTGREPKQSGPAKARELMEMLGPTGKTSR